MSISSEITHTVICIFEILLGALALSLVLPSEGPYLSAAWFIAGCCPLHLQMLLIAHGPYYGAIALSELCI